MIKVDLPGEKDIQQLLADLRADAEELGNTVCFALLDGIQASPVMKQVIEESSWHRAGLYQRYRGQGIERVEPVLLAVPVDDRERLTSLIYNCAGSPMLSFISTHYGLDELKAHLERQLEMNHPQGYACLLRWSDTRCLPSLYHAFNEGQRARLLNGLHAWHFFGRDGSLQTLDDGKQPVAAEPDIKPFALSPYQVTVMSAASEADALLMLIEQDDGFKDQLAGLPSKRYQAACAALETAHAGSTEGEKIQLIIERLRKQELLTT